MTAPKIQEWTPCAKPAVGDTLKWNEPLWAPPNKPRGKRDKIGEQEIIADLKDIKDALEFIVLDVKKISTAPADLKVKKHDIIKRKLSSLALGNCQKLVKE